MDKETKKKLYDKIFNENSQRYLGGKGFESDIFRLMDKCFEHSDQQTKHLTEQLAEANESIIELEKLHIQKVENIGFLNKERHKLIEQLSKLQGKTNFDEVEALKEQLSQKDFELKAADHALAEKEKELSELKSIDLYKELEKAFIYSRNYPETNVKEFREIIAENYPKQFINPNK